jgi:type VI secretion system secreted protein VgrG
MGGHAATATYRNEFEAIPARVPFRPARATPLPTVRGTQSAVVVGKAGEEIWTDEHGRVKVQFHWDREGKRDENSTCWIRVVHPWSGKAWGMVNVPRIGQEVVVDFLEGDPDRPLIIGRVSNAEQTPGSFSHASRLPGDHALAGWKSRELAGGSGYGELLFDDTAGELRTKLSSEHATTQLNLGYLTHPRANAKAEPRGEGYELRTDGWGSVRAAKGLLLTTDGQARAVGGQLDRSELVACLEEALNLARSLGERAGQHRADAGDRAPQQKIMEGAHDWGSGSNAESKGGGAGGAPLVAVSAPAGIALTTPRAITSFSGEHTDLVARKNHQLTSGQTTNINAGTGMSFYADSGGIRSIANRGVHLTQAQQDDVVINADRSIRLTASHEHILAVAQKHITLMAGGAYIKIEGGNIELGCPGTVRIKAANYSLTGPASLAEELPKFDVGKTDLRYVLSYDAERLQPAADMKYRITLKGGEVVEGLTDAAGRTTVLEKDAMHIADIELLRPR